MPHHRSAILLASILLPAMLLVSCQPETTPSTPDPPEDSEALDVTLLPDPTAGGKQLLMHYMPWYIADTPGGRGKWGAHWTGWRKQHDPTVVNAQGLPDIWSHYHPLLGPYDSTDPHVLERQLLQMKLAGVNGVIADWYGLSDAADYPPIHEATVALFEACRRLGMTFAVCYEDRTVELLIKREKLKPDEVAQHLTDMMRWLDENWFSDPAYVRIDGRPLLLNFGPIYVKDAATWDAALGAVEPRPAFYPLHHLWQKVDGDGGFSWVHKHAWKDDATPEQVTERLHREFFYRTKDPTKMIVSAVPGFRDVYDKPHPMLEHREGRTMRESLDAAMSGPWPIVQLVTWNDYGEGTMIEPTHEFGYLFLEIISDARRKEIGEAFTPSHDDLRLPARLYALRERGDIAEDQLDRIAALLAGWRCDDARKLIESLE